MPIKYILSDLDGVIRHYPIERSREIERKFALQAGALFSAAFEKQLLKKAVTGFISDEIWRTEIVRSLAERYSAEVAIKAVEEWSTFPGQIDVAYLECLQTRFSGIPVAILTNGTTFFPGVSGFQFPPK